MFGFEFEFELIVAPAPVSQVIENIDVEHSAEEVEDSESGGEDEIAKGGMSPAIRGAGLFKKKGEDEFKTSGDEEIDTTLNADDDKDRGIGVDLLGSPVIEPIESSDVLSALPLEKHFSSGPDKDNKDGGRMDSEALVAVRVVFLSLALPLLVFML